MKIESFNFEYFKEYVSTYDPKKQTLDSDPETIFKDMLYGLGVSIKKDDYAFADGFTRFKNFLKRRFTVVKNYMVVVT